jgi:transposase InsO family protein
MCSFFSVSRSGYYDWTKREHENGRDLYLRSLIAECQEKHKKRYGYRRVRLWLQREHRLAINHKAVLRVMNKYNLLSVTRRKGYYRRMLSAEMRYPNILERNFKATAPNQKWCTDISYIKTKEGYLFLSIIKDLYDNFIVSYEMSKLQDYGLVDRTLKVAKQAAGNIGGVILHSDQGYQYTSFAYKELTGKYGITPSMSRPGTPLDNACAENFFSILKCECIYREKPKTLDTAEQLIDEYIEYYNYERLQVKCGCTPYEWRTMAYNAA